MFTDDMEVMTKLKSVFVSNDMFIPVVVFPTGASCAAASQASTAARAGTDACV